MNIISKILVLIVFLSTLNSISQTKQELENKKNQIKKEIKNIELKLSENRKNKDVVISDIEDIKFKIDLQEELILNINTQLNLILDEINENEKNLFDLNERQIILKNEFSKMLNKSFKNRLNLNKIMFVFSSSSFVQAYKRIQYFKQYAKHQTKTLEKIKFNTNRISNLIIDLNSKRTDKLNLVNENEAVKKNLVVQYDSLNSQIIQINQNQEFYASQINEKNKKVLELDKQIQKIIESAIDKSEFLTTAEVKKLSKEFNSNKGRLPWPVSNGYVILGFGKQPHPIVKTAIIQSNGVRIRTSKGLSARSIFNGVVYSIIVSKTKTYTVIIQHGSFFSVYKNLKSIAVNKGDEVFTKDLIGEITTDSTNGQTILNFSIFKDGKAEDPTLWIYKM